MVGNNLCPSVDTKKYIQDLLLSEKNQSWAAFVEERGGGLLIYISICSYLPKEIIERFQKKLIDSGYI